MSTKKQKNLHKNANHIGYKSIIITLILSVMFLSASGCTDSSPVTSVTLTTDNDTYRSSEEMIITVDITASRDVDVTHVNISGIKNSFERNMLEDSKTMSLTEGDNTVQFTFETPSCGDCSGVAAGNHTINAIVEVDGIKYNATVVVVLEADEDEKDGGETDGGEADVDTAEDGADV